MKSNKKNVGILGGTFNPVHMGHLILAENAYSQLGLDKVIFMPTGVSYCKNPKEVLPAQLRYEMCVIATSDNNHFEVSDFEIKRSGNTYTCETLEALSRMYNDTLFYFIVGEDSLYAVDSWYDPQRIFDNCVFVVAPRNHVVNERMYEQGELLKSKYNAKIVFLNAPDIDISSNMIRDRIRNNISVRYYISDKVYDYILTNSLYV